MKKVLIVLTAITALTACGKLDRQHKPGPDGEKTSSVVVEIQGIPIGSKADGDQRQTPDEMKVSQYDIAVYDAAGLLEWSEHIDKADSPRHVITGLGAGRKTIAVAANINAGMPATLAAFGTLPTDLRDNRLSEGFVMVGTAEAVAAEEPEVVKLSLKRIAAKISVEGNITTAWLGDAPESFVITDIYVANVATRSNYAFSGTAGPSVNLRSTEDLTTDDVYRSLTVSQRTFWESGKPFNGGVGFYVYPNSDSARTCIIIKALYNGEVTYYPVRIDQAITSNTLYTLGDVKITWRGVDKPWEEYSRIAISLQLKVKDWEYIRQNEVIF